MTTWEKATEADIQQIRLLLRTVAQSGAAPPALPPTVTEDDLSPLTKRQAGALLTALREMVRDGDR